MILSLISFLLIGLTLNFPFINTFPIFANTFPPKIITNNQIAEKYCDSLRKNLFTGLEQESALKYEYFFSEIPDNSIKDKNKFLKKFKSDVKSICSYEISKSNEKEFDLFLKNYFKTRNNTPKIKVEATKPTPTNPAIIPVFRKTFTVANSLPSFLAMIFLLK